MRLKVAESVLLKMAKYRFIPMIIIVKFLHSYEIVFYFSTEPVVLIDLIT